MCICCKAADDDLAGFQLGVCHRAYVLLRRGCALGQRIESKLRRAGPRFEPGIRDVGATRFVVDDRNTAAIEHIDAIEPQPHKMPGQRESPLRLHFLRYERGSRTLEVVQPSGDQ
jgi:hypothetical protein